MAAFVGRTEPLDRLVAAYRALTAEPNAIARGARLVLVTGEAGIGKTTLLRRFAGDATAAGGVVVWGSAWDGQAPAWWPWTQALRALVGPGGAPRDTPAELAAILPELGPAAPDGDAGRVRVFDAVDRLLARSAGRTPVVVVLDDLHWADPSTVDLIRFLIRRAGRRCCSSARTGRMSSTPPLPLGSRSWPPWRSRSRCVRWRRARWPSW